MLDLHLHVWPHQPGTPTPTLSELERYCEVAAARGIEQIAITEHSHRFTRVIDQVMPHWERLGATFNALGSEKSFTMSKRSKR